MAFYLFFAFCTELTMDPTKPPIGRARGRARGNQGVAPSGG